MHYQYLFLHWNCEFYTARKYVLQFKKCNVWAIFGCISDQCIFYIGTAKRRSANHRHIFRGHDIRTKQNSAHEGTTALEQRYTDARATRLMTPTSMEVDSYSCMGCSRIQWHFYALSAIRIRPPSCCNVRAFPTWLLAAYALEYTICTTCFLISCLQDCLALHTCGTLNVHWAAMFGHRTFNLT